MIRKILDENWHQHFAFCFLATLAFLPYMVTEGNFWYAFLGLPFTAFMIGVFREFYFFKEKKAKFSWEDCVANALGAMIGVLIFYIF